MLLLLCLVRVQLPEAWVLLLHPHQHTEHEETQRPGWAKGKALIGQQHQHCHAEQLFDAPFQAAAPVQVPVRLSVPRYLALRVPATLSNSAVALRGTALRGPPQGLLSAWYCTCCGYLEGNKAGQGSPVGCFVRVRPQRADARGPLPSQRISRECIPSRNLFRQAGWVRNARFFTGVQRWLSGGCQLGSKPGHIPLPGRRWMAFEAVYSSFFQGFYVRRAWMPGAYTCYVAAKPVSCFIFFTGVGLGVGAVSGFRADFDCTSSISSIRQSGWPRG